MPITKKYFYHISFWVILWLLTFFAISRFENPTYALGFSACLILPIIIPVYIHLVVFDRFFLTKKYILYILLLLSLVIVFGLINELIMQVFMEAEVEGYITILVFILMFTGFKYLEIGTKQQFQIEREEAMRIKAQERQVSAELNLLKSQVNPHFLFNTLNNIYSLILEKDEKAGEAVLKLSGLLRYLLDSSSQKYVSLNKECEFIENYLALEKIRLANRCSISFLLTGDPIGKKITPMLLIPFVENAFKHGISSSPDKNHIIIELEILETEIKFYVENGIVERKNHIKEKANSTGLENVKRRLDLVYPNKHQLTINESTDIFKVELLMTL